METTERNHSKNLWLDDYNQIADTQEIRLIIEGEQASMFTGKVKDYKLYFDLTLGISVRELQWNSPKGKEVMIKIKRMASHYLKSLHLVEYEIIPLNFTAEVVFESVHEGDFTKCTDEQNPQCSAANKKNLNPVSHEFKDDISIFKSRTANPELEVCSCVKNVLSEPYQGEIVMENNKSINIMKTLAKKNNKLKLTKYSVFCDSLRSANCSIKAQEEMINAISIPIDAFYRKQEFFSHVYWKESAQTKKQMRA